MRFRFLPLREIKELKGAETDAWGEGNSMEIPHTGMRQRRMPWLSWDIEMVSWRLARTRRDPLTLRTLASPEKVQGQGGFE